MKTVYIVVYLQDHRLFRGKELKVTEFGLVLTKLDDSPALINPLDVHSVEIEENPLA